MARENSANKSKWVGPRGKEKEEEEEKEEEKEEGKTEE